MGKLEQELKKEIRRTRINTAIIRTLAVGGVIAVGILAPNVLGALGKLGLINPAQKRQTIRKSLGRLIENGYVSFEKGEVRLTRKGEKLAAFLGEGRMKVSKPRRWDGKWRILIFDIPERRKISREKVRNMLIELGFKKIQDSVWTYPYDCEDLIQILKADLRIGKDLLYIIADKVERDRALRQEFGLP